MPKQRSPSTPSAVEPPSPLADIEWPAVTLSEHEGVRYLHLDSPWVQGGMRISKPQMVQIDYVQRMLACLLWLPSADLGQGQAVQLGLGAGALTRFTAQVLRMATLAVEINPQVVAVNQTHFHLPAAAEVVQGDALAWLSQAAPASVRLLFVDLYDHEAAAPVLDSEGFYRLCQSVLEEGGLMSVNLFGRDASFHDSMGRIASAFGQNQVWSLRPTREGNTVVVAGKSVPLPGRKLMNERATFLEMRFGNLGLPARKWPPMVRAMPTEVLPSLMGHWP
jgi:spermidine synthase